MAPTSGGPSPLSRFRFLFLFLFRPKWIAFHALVLAAVFTMVNLGIWQLHRLDERRINNADFVVQIEQAPVSLASVLDELRVDPEAYVNRRVQTTGTYFPDQIVLFNRSQGGGAVDNVLTRLETQDGAVLLVNRGAIPVQATPPTPFPREVQIEGRLRLSESRERGGLSDAEQTVITELRRVNIDQIAAESPGTDYIPMYVELLESSPAAGPTDPQLLDPPELSEGNHLSYAFQWFIFAFSVAVGWIFAVRWSLTTAAAAERTPSDFPPSGDAESTMGPA
jgi:cytochrome oxidase assembly protein ShyY1